MLKRLHTILFICFLAICYTSLANGDHLVDRVVAVVNDDVITLSEVENEGEDYFERIRAKAPPREVEMALDKAREDVLGSLIEKTIVRQEAARLSITVEEPEVDRAIDQVLSRNNATIEDFRKELAMMNISEHQYRDNLRDQILRSKLIGYEVRSRIVIVEDDIKEYYQNEYTQKKGESGYNILQMGFTWRNSVSLAKAGFDTKKDARKMAEEIRARAVDGESFIELAKAYSNLPTAIDGGELGILQKEEMAGYMKDAILSLHPGDISPIIETGNTFQFFKLLSVREGDIVSKAPYESVRDEIRDILYQQEMEEQYKIWVNGLRDKAYINIML